MFVQIIAQLIFLPLSYEYGFIRPLYQGYVQTRSAGLFNHSPNRQSFTTNNSNYHVITKLSIRLAAKLLFLYGKLLLKQYFDCFNCCEIINIASENKSLDITVYITAVNARLKIIRDR